MSAPDSAMQPPRRRPAASPVRQLPAPARRLPLTALATVLSTALLAQGCGGQGGADGSQAASGSGPVAVNAVAQTGSRTDPSAGAAGAAAAGSAGASTGASAGTTAAAERGAAPVGSTAENSGATGTTVGGDTSGTTGTTPVLAPKSPVEGAWSPTIHWPVVAIHSAITPDGRLLTFGNSASDRNDYVFYYDVWDPVLGTGAAAHTTAPNTTGTYIFCGSVITSPLTGRILVNGGDVLGADNRVTNDPSPDINVFDPSTNSLTRVGQLRRPRWYSTSTTLMDGSIFVQGGKGGNDYGEILDRNGVSARLVDGWNNSNFDNNYPRNWITPAGLIYGYDAGNTYLLDLSANGGRGARTVLPDQWLRGWAATSSAAMYRPGSLVVIGGSDPRITHVDLNGATPVVTSGPDLPEARQWLNTTVLPDGRVFVSGGTELNPLEDQPDNQKVGNVPYHTYLYDPDTRTLQRTAAMAQIRTYHSTAILLPDASVLSGGGGEPGPVTNLNTEIYYPPYLYNADGSLATRPVIASAPYAADPAAAFDIVSPDAADIRSVVLMKTGAVTHSNNMEQRRVPVTFTRTGTTLTLQLPSNANLTPPGYYMVFAIGSTGVPSLAKIVRINAA